MSELITLPKVTGTFECDKHRTISLISHAAKIALEVIRLRVNHFIAPQIAEEQFGFVSGKEEEEEEEEEERLLWQINNNTMLYMISFATETPIKTCNMSLAWEPPYNIMIK